MTPAQEGALIAAVAAGLEGELRDALAQIIEQIRAGTAPRDAVDNVMRTFTGAMAETMAAALSGMLAQTVGAPAVLAMQVGAVSLSVRLYAESQAAGVAVEGVVRRHLAGWQDARALAREIFEGYSFRLPEAEVIRMAPDNPRLAKYLREALLPDRPVRAGLQTAFQRAQLQVSELSTPALRAAYQQLLDAVEALREGAGQKLLDKQIEVSFFERMRYFAQRIAQTELHRAYAEREALLLLEDEAVQYVQLRRAPGRGLPCICVLFTGRDLYGLGPGVYPKADAPVPPLHPFCRCVMSPRLDLTGRVAKKRDEDGDAYFLRRLDAPIAARIVGSQAKLARVLAGDTAEAVANASRDPQYRIKRAGQV